MKPIFVRLTALIAFSALGLGGGCTCASRETPDGNAGSHPDAALDTSGGSTGSGGVADARDALEEPEAAPCSPTPISKVTPAGWVRFPGLPCQCDLWVAPSAEQMGPPPSWITRPSGVLELENNWADYAHRVLAGSAVGESYGGQQIIAYGRDLGRIDDGAPVHELVVLRLPTNEVLFRGREPGGYFGKCHLRVAAVGRGNVLYYAWESVSGLGPRRWVLAGGAAPAAVPELIYATTDATSRVQFAIARSVVGSLRASAEAVDVIPLGVGDPAPKWVFSASASNSVDLLGAWESTVFFVEYDNDSHGEIWAWDEARGLRRFLPRTGDGPGLVGSVCGLGTDGQTLVWTQYSGWNGSAWDRIDVMKAPFTTDETALEPVRVRAARGGNGGCRTWRVGAGYAASSERVGQKKLDPEELSVIRLSDGQAFDVPVRPGFRYGLPLYVSAVEIAMEEDHTDPNDAGVIGHESWTIVRYPLSLLGPGTPASVGK